MSDPDHRAGPAARASATPQSPSAPKSLDHDAVADVDLRGLLDDGGRGRPRIHRHRVHVGHVRRQPQHRGSRQHVAVAGNPP